MGKHELRCLDLGQVREDSGSLAALSPIRTPAPLRSVIGDSEVITTLKAAYSMESKPKNNKTRTRWPGPIPFHVSATPELVTRTGPWSHFCASKQGRVRVF